MKRLLTNFLWSGGDGYVDTRARVSWDTITHPIAWEGLGILDLEHKNRSLLVKLLVRGLTLREQP